MAYPLPAPHRAHPQHTLDFKAMPQIQQVSISNIYPLYFDMKSITNSIYVHNQQLQATHGELCFLNSKYFKGPQDNILHLVSQFNNAFLL